MIPSNVLLIHPPAASPVHPCWEAALVAGSLSGSGLNPCHYDANLDFYREYFFENEVETGCETREEIKKLSGKEFFDIPHFIGCTSKINTGMALISHADSSAGFQNDGDFNPFALLSEKGLAGKFFQYDPGTVIFFVCSQDQVFATQTMAAYIKSTHPGVQVLAMTNIRWEGLDSQYVDHLIWNQGPRSLIPMMDFFSRAYDLNIDPQTGLPDFDGLYLDSYLTPERVFRIDPFFFKDPVLLATFLEDQVCTRRIQGFVFTQALFPPDTLARAEGNVTFEIQEKKDVVSLNGIYQQLSHWLSIKQSRVFFSVQIRLGEIFPEDEFKLSDLFSAGLRLIRWEGGEKKHYHM